MKLRHHLFLAAGLGLAAVTAQAQSATGFAPANIAGHVFRATVTSGTGSASTSGAFTQLFAVDGQDYSVGNTGALSDPARYTYSKTGDNTARITETQANNQTVTVDLTFTSATAGNFTANYGGGNTQAGTFTVMAVPSGSPLLNMSTRATIAAGGQAIAGLVVGGSGPRRVLLRVVGPGLAAFNVANAMSNPTLTVFSGTQSVGTNDDWSSDAAAREAITAATARVGAFALATNSRDAVLLATVNPGNYTVVARGAGAADAGEVLLETYFLD